MVIAGNILVIFLICAFAYPVFRDARLLALVGVFALLGAGVLFSITSRGCASYSVFR